MPLISRLCLISALRCPHADVGFPQPHAKLYDSYFLKLTEGYGWKFYGAYSPSLPSRSVHRLHTSFARQSRKQNDKNLKKGKKNLKICCRIDWKKSPTLTYKGTFTQEKSTTQPHVYGREKPEGRGRQKSVDPPPQGKGREGKSLM